MARPRPPAAERRRVDLGRLETRRPADVDEALAQAYQRFGDACQEARRTLLRNQPGRLPTWAQCAPEQRPLLEELEDAERELDQLRLLARVVLPPQERRVG